MARSAKIAAIADPTGVADVVAAYTYPKCSSYFPNQFTGLPDPAQWVEWSFRPDKSQPPNAFIGGYEGDRPNRICRGQQTGDAFPGSHLLHFDRDYAAMNAVYAGYFVPGQRPARTCVGVSGLAKGALIEIDLVARREAC